MKLNPIIAVTNVEESSKQQQTAFDWTSRHGGSEFDVLVTSQDEIVLCLHKWGEHDHPTLHVATILPEKGLILQFRTESTKEIRAILTKL